MTIELYRKHRPTRLKQVKGQREIIRSLVELGKRRALPHFLLFTGPSGTGKTTVARILRKGLKCGCMDFRELNVADFRGIDMVRSIRDNMMLASMGGETRMWLIDEAHKITSDGQDAFLKLLEDTPSHVYFIFCTTNPEKLKPTIITRATQFKFAPLSRDDLAQLIEEVAEKEEGFDKVLSGGVVEKLVDASEGSARKALVLLHAIIGLETEEDQLDAIAKGDVKAKAIELARALMRPNANWGSVAKIVKDLDDEPEQLRWMVLGYCRSVLLGGGKLAGRAAMILERFQDNFYDSKNAGLALACYDVVNSK